MLKSKIFIALAFVLALATVSFTPSSANAATVTLRNIEGPQKYVIEGNGGSARKTYYVTIAVRWNNSGHTILTYVDNNYSSSGINMPEYIKSASGIYIDKGKSRQISFTGNGRMVVPLGLQKHRNNDASTKIQVDIDLPPGFSIRKI